MRRPLDMLIADVLCEILDRRDRERRLRFWTATVGKVRVR